MAIPNSCELIDTTIVGPDGTRHEVTNLKQFSRDHGLDNGNLYQVYIGARRHHQGYTCPEAGYVRIYNGIPTG